MSNIKYPITVNKISFKQDETIHKILLFGGKCGDMVAVRPCDEKYEGKTFIGILLGEVALAQGAMLNEKDGELKVVKEMYNPAIFVPEHNEIVYGCGSWWGKIKNEDQLKQITDADISNIWYVRALKQLSEAAVKLEAGATPEAP